MSTETSNENKSPESADLAPKKELTPEQIANKREKNRRRNERKKEQNKEPVVAVENSVVSTGDSRPPRLSQEEYTQGLIDKKSQKIKDNPKSAVVSTADSEESKLIAYKINEINQITDFVRSRMGGDIISFADGIELLMEFKDGVLQNLENFIKHAHSKGVGSKYAIIEYKEIIRKENARKRIFQERIEKSMLAETDTEKKEREATEKEIAKANTDLNKAQETINKAQASKEEALATLESLRAREMEELNARAAAQKVRRQEEQAAAKEAKEAKAKEAREAKAKEAREAKEASTTDAEIEKSKN